jgi:hypothetical protein
VDGSGSVSLFFAVTIQTTTAMAIRAATTAPPDTWRGIRQPYGKKDCAQSGGRRMTSGCLSLLRTPKAKKMMKFFGHLEF